MHFKDIYFIKLLKFIYKNFLEKRIFVFLFFATLLLNFLTLFFVSFKGRPENFLIPLHYSVVNGIDKIGPWFYMYKIPLAGFLVLIINFFIIFRLKKSDDLKGAYILSGATVFLEVLFLIASLLVVFRT